LNKCQLFQIQEVNIYFEFYSFKNLFLKDERLTKEESSILIKENNLSNKSMILLNYPQLFSSSTSSSPTELDNSRQESIHFPGQSPSGQQQQGNSLYTDLTPVLNSTPLPSFETLNRINSFIIFFFEIVLLIYLGSECYFYNQQQSSDEIWRSKSTNKSN